MPVYEFTLDKNSTLVIGDCKVSLDSITSRTQIRLGFDAPKSTGITRKEILSVTKRAACERAENRIKKVCERQSPRTLSLKKER